MITIQIDNANIGINEVETPMGVMRIMTATDASGVRVVIPFDAAAAYTIGQALQGKKAIQLAGSMPPQNGATP